MAQAECDAIGAGTGFIGVTDRRVVIQDNSFVGKKTASTSVPYTRVNAVSFVSDKSMFGKFASSSAIALSAGGQTYEVQFRGDDEARRVHDAVLMRMLGLDPAEDEDRRLDVNPVSSSIRSATLPACPIWIVLVPCSKQPVRSRA